MTGFENEMLYNNQAKGSKEVVFNMTVYLDIVFLENLCMNYIILFATGLISKYSIKQIRLVLSSLLGSLYAVFSFTSILKNEIGLILKVILSIGMVYLAFNPRNVKKMLKTLLVFYLTSFAFGGCAFALLYFIKPQDIFMKNGLFIGTYPIKIALLGGIVGFTLIITTFKVVKSRISKKDMFCMVTLFLNEKKQTVKAMIDTGNLLRDPITHIPVIVVESDSLTGMLPDDILKHTEEMIGGDTKVNMETIEESFLSKFRVIPFTSLGKEHGLLLGVKADKIEIDYEDMIYVIPRVIIGIYTKSLNKNRNYTALVGLDMIGEEGMTYESIGDSKSKSQYNIH